MTRRTKCTRASPANAARAAFSNESLPAPLGPTTSTSIVASPSASGKPRVALPCSATQRRSTPMFTTRPEIAGTFGVVASTHWLASSTGMAVLERGGNAFDAAVATAFVLQVAEPHLNGPGGDAPIILHDANTARQRVICGQGPSPRGATIAAFEALGLDLIPGTGLLPAVVPGAFDAWCLLL